MDCAKLTALYANMKSLWKWIIKGCQLLALSVCYLHPLRLIFS